MSDIVLNGVSLNELRKQKQAIQKDAAKFISQGQDEVKALIKQIIASESNDEKEALSSMANKILGDISLVSGVSDVQFYLDYRDQWGDYYDEKPLSLQVENILEYSRDDQNNLLELYNNLESMEYEVRQWNASYC